MVVEGAGGNLHPPHACRQQSSAYGTPAALFLGVGPQSPVRVGEESHPTQHPVAVKAEEVSLEKLPALCSWK